MVLGAGRGQLDLIKAIKKYGHTAIVTSISGEYPGFELADEICYADISSPLAVEKVVVEKNIDGICTCCLDTGMESLGYICEKYGFNGPSEEAAKTARDKLLMKEKFVQGGVKTPRYMKASSEEDLFSAVDLLGFPVIIKAVDQQGSLGINVATDEAVLKKAYANTKANTKKDYCLVEQYVVGEKHGANGCIVNGNILFLLPSEDFTNENAVLGHVFPFDINDSIYDKIIYQSKIALNSVGLDNCLFNVDYIIRNDEIYIIEITGRMGANGIPELLSTYYGIDIYKIIVDMVIGEDPTGYFKQNAISTTPCCSKMLISSESGRLVSIMEQFVKTDYIVSATYFVERGDQIHKYQSAKDCLGQIIVKGTTAKSCKMYADQIARSIEFVLEE